VNVVFLRQFILAQTWQQRTGRISLVPLERKKSEERDPFRRGWDESGDHNSQQNLPWQRDQSARLGAFSPYRDTEGRLNEIFIRIVTRVSIVILFYIKSSCSNVSFAGNLDLQHEQASAGLSIRRYGPLRRSQDELRGRGGGRERAIGGLRGELEQKLSCRFVYSVGSSVR